MNLRIKKTKEQELSITKALGITDKRMNELAELLTNVTHDALGSEKSISKMMEELSAHCNTPEEMSFVMYSLGAFTQKMKSSVAPPFSE